jgi:hypothetical protein
MTLEYVALWREKSSVEAPVMFGQCSGLSQTHAVYLGRRVSVSGLAGTIDLNRRLFLAPRQRKLRQGLRAKAWRAESLLRGFLGFNVFTFLRRSARTRIWILGVIRRRGV